MQLTCAHDPYFIYESHPIPKPCHPPSLISLKLTIPHLNSKLPSTTTPPLRNLTFAFKCMEKNLKSNRCFTMSYNQHNLDPQGV